MNVARADERKLPLFQRPKILVSVLRRGGTPQSRCADEVGARTGPGPTSQIIQVPPSWQGNVLKKKIKKISLPKYQFN